MWLKVRYWPLQSNKFTDRNKDTRSVTWGLDDRRQTKAKKNDKRFVVLFYDTIVYVSFMKCHNMALSLIIVTVF